MKKYASFSDCRRFVKSMNGAVLLYRLAFRQRRPHVTGNDGSWVVLTREQWAVETGLSIQGFDRALMALKKISMVVTKQAPYQGVNRSHVRLSLVAMERLKIVQLNANHFIESDKQNGDHFIENEKQLGLTPYIPLDESKYTKACEDKSSPEVEPDEQKEVNGRDDMTLVADVLKGSTLKPGPSKVTLAACWRDQMIESKHLTYVPPMTQKQRGQFRLFEQRCPTGRAKEILTRCIRHWTEFVEDARADAGLTTAPAVPAIGFLLTHLAIAVKFCETPEKPSKASQKGVTKITLAKHPHDVQSPALTKPTVKEDTPATKEQVMAILGEDYEKNKGK